MIAAGERPALDGFFHEKLFPSAREAADVRGRMVEFAARWDYRLAKVFTDKPDEVPAGFNALREAVHRDRAAVVVPTVDRLKPYGDVYALVEELSPLRPARHAIRTRGRLMRRAAGSLVVAQYRVSPVARMCSPARCPSHLAARHRELPRSGARAYCMRLPARVPFHLRGAGECPSGVGVRHPR